MTHTASKAIPDEGALGPPEPTLQEAVALLKRWREAYAVSRYDGLPSNTRALLERCDAARWAEKEVHRG